MAAFRMHIGFHFFGAGNLGDDLMMGGFLSHLARRGISAELSCSITTDFFNAGSQQARFPQVRWLPYDLAQREECIRNCDVWLGLGDSPFQLDSGPWFLDHLTEELALCKKYQKPMFFLCVGVNDVPATRDARTRVLLDYATRVWTRDEASAAHLAHVAGSAKIQSGTDLAHLWLAQHRWGKIEAGTWACLLHFENQELFSAAVVAATAADLRLRPGRWLVQEVREWPGTERANHKLLDAPTRLRLPLRLPDYRAPQVAALLKPWGTPEVMISSRYHGGAVAAWMGARLVLVARNEKLKGLSRQLGALELASVTDAAQIRRALALAQPVPAYLLTKLLATAENCCDQFFQECGLSRAARAAAPVLQS